MKKRGLPLFCALLTSVVLTVGNGTTIVMATEATPEASVVSPETPEACSRKLRMGNSIKQYSRLARRT